MNEVLPDLFRPAKAADTGVPGRPLEQLPDVIAWGSVTVMLAAVQARISSLEKQLQSANTSNLSVRKTALASLCSLGGDHQLRNGWGGRIRTSECRYQKPVP